MADKKWNIFGLKTLFQGVGGKVLDFFGGGPNGQKFSGPLSQSPQSLLPPGASSQANVHQQTSYITVNGAADANQVGKVVLGGQDRINFDMTRNLKGAMQ